MLCTVYFGQTDSPVPRRVLRGVPAVQPAACAGWALHRHASQSVYLCGAHSCTRQPPSRARQPASAAPQPRPSPLAAQVPGSLVVTESSRRPPECGVNTTGRARTRSPPPSSPRGRRAPACLDPNFNPVPRPLARQEPLPRPGLTSASAATSAAPRTAPSVATSARAADPRAGGRRHEQGEHGGDLGHALQRGQLQRGRRAGGAGRRGGRRKLL